MISDLDIEFLLLMMMIIIIVKFIGITPEFRETILLCLNLKILSQNVQYV